MSTDRIYAVDLDFRNLDSSHFGNLAASAVPTLSAKSCELLKNELVFIDFADLVTYDANQGEGGKRASP